jgi:ATP-dependent 26S proteasome regulatory subunit
MLDPAVVREGRIDRKVEVSRPTLADAKEIAHIHLRDIPIEDMTRGQASTFIAEKTVDKARDSISGAMLAGVVDRSTTYAIHRSLHGRVTGISETDINNAVQTIKEGL